MMHFLSGLSTFVLMIVAFGVLLFVAAVIYTMRFQLRLRRIDGMTRPEFINFFAHQDGGERIAGCVYDEYRGEAYFSVFKLSPETDLAKTFAQEPEDICDAAKEIVVKLGLPQLTEDDLRSIKSEDHFTAGQMVELLLSRQR